MENTKIAIGIDIIEIKRITVAVKKSEHFTERVFTQEEIAYSRSRKKGVYASLSGIYAAKEAFCKALGTGFRFGAWHEIEVKHNEWGAPFLSVKGVFAQLLKERGYKSVLISISHCKEYATSQVMLHR